VQALADLRSAPLS